jgi:hypothetical protein
MKKQLLINEHPNAAVYQTKAFGKPAANFSQKYSRAKGQLAK